MASFDTDVRKLQKLWTAGQYNGNYVDSTLNTQIIKQNQVIELTSTKLNFNKIINKDVDFQDIAVIPISSVPYDCRGFIWTITTSCLQDWISLVRIAIACYPPPTDSSSVAVDPFLNSNTQFSWTVSIVPLMSSDSDGNPVSTGLVTATFSIVFVTTAIGQVLPTDMQGKLYFRMINPNIIY